MLQLGAQVAALQFQQVAILLQRAQFPLLPFSHVQMRCHTGIHFCALFLPLKKLSINLIQLPHAHSQFLLRLLSLLGELGYSGERAFLVGHLGFMVAADS
jgi:hypothetical protein